MRAVVVFSDRPKLDWWDWIFRTREGFRHCWIAVETPGGWIELNARSHWLEVDWLERPGYDLAAFYRRQGYRVVEREAMEPVKQCRGLGWWSCVEVIKGVLGIRDVWCWTPYQLWRRLN